MNARSFGQLPFAVLAVLATALAVAGCSLSLEHDPATTVTIKITGISDETDRDEVQEILTGMTDGSGHRMSSMASGDQMTIQLSPVSDVKALSRKINFGEVTEVEGRTITIEFVE